jgi:hypothetical protein
MTDMRTQMSPAWFSYVTVNELALGLAGDVKKPVPWQTGVGGAVSIGASTKEVSGAGASGGELSGCELSIGEAFGEEVSGWVEVSVEESGEELSMRALSEEESGDASGWPVELSCS